MLFAACTPDEENKNNSSGNQNQGQQGTPEDNPGNEYKPTAPFTFGAVDLGLSVKWANANVGADSEIAPGNYYAWGETEPKTQYDWTTYKWCEGDYNNLTKYNCQYEYGKLDANKTLDNGDDIEDTTIDDVARAVLKGKWRMPTADEMEELLNGCVWTKKDNGYIVKSKTSDNFIFLPLAGYKGEGEGVFHEGDGFYWTSSLLSSMSFCSTHLFFGKEGGAPNLDNTNRDFGASVRGVLPE